MDCEWLGDQDHRQPDHVAERVLVPALTADGSPIPQFVMVWARIAMTTPAMQDVDNLVLLLVLQHVSEGRAGRCGKAKKR